MKAVSAIVAATGLALVLVGPGTTPDPRAAESASAARYLPAARLPNDVTGRVAGASHPTQVANAAVRGRHSSYQFRDPSETNSPVPPAPSHAAPAPDPSEREGSVVSLRGESGRVAHPDDPATANDLVRRYCVRCHSDRRLLGNMSLQDFDATRIEPRAALGEKMVRKLRAGMMPPPDERRPTGDSLNWLASVLEGELDRLATQKPNPGFRTFQRLNRSEYELAIFELLGLRIDASAYLPPETMSGGFDNVADVQQLSATLLDGYLTAAAEVSRAAMGDPFVSASESTYRVPRYAEQRSRVEGAPFGTRGGISVIHNFPADGMYRFRMGFQHESTGNFFGQTSPYDERLEISIDGERRALLEVDRWIHVQDPDGPNLRTDPIFVAAGPHRVSAAFVETMQGPVEDLISPHGWSLADKKIGYSYGITALAHLRDFAITGPFDPSGVSDFEVRKRLLSCEGSRRVDDGRGDRSASSPTSNPTSNPTSSLNSSAKPLTAADRATRDTDPANGDAYSATRDVESEECARRTIAELATRAFRRGVDDDDLEPLMAIYRQGAERAGAANGVRTALQAILASPDFIFRLEEVGEAATSGAAYPLTAQRLATRLAFFVWSRGPDRELLQAAQQGSLDSPQGLRVQVDRLLNDPRAEALATRFAAQWLRLQDLDKIHPDALRFPDYHQQLADAMRRETELFFYHLVREDRPLLEILTADYTFLNERLARHYGIPGVAGDHFRKVEYPDGRRRGVLSHGSMLTSTSHANRTSPVLRGKWVMEVLLGTPPPPPPPDVSDLEATDQIQEGRHLTVRERLEMHRASPQCTSCHKFIDPIGLALENFDVTGAWRIKEEGMRLDPSGELYDGTPLSGPNDLLDALLERRTSLTRTFIENLMSYAIGRRVEYFDGPTVRRIERAVAADGYRMSSFIHEVVASEAFRMGSTVPDTMGGS